MEKESRKKKKRGGGAPRVVVTGKMGETVRYEEDMRNGGGVCVWHLRHVSL